MLSIPKCRFAWVWAVSSSSLLLGGCSRAPSGQPDAPRPIPSSITETIPRPEASIFGAQTSLRTVDEAEFAQALKEHRGKVVLVEFWATWCLQCLELLPHTVELYNKHADQGLAVISVSLDYPDDDRQRVFDLLKLKGATFDNFISRYGGDAKSLEVFAIEGGALPNLKLYDRSGKLRKTFAAGVIPPEPFGLEDVSRAVEELLEEPSE